MENIHCILREQGGLTNNVRPPEADAHAALEGTPSFPGLPRGELSWIRFPYADSFKGHPHQIPSSSDPLKGPRAWCMVVVTGGVRAFEPLPVGAVPRAGHRPMLHVTLPGLFETTPGSACALLGLVSVSSCTLSTIFAGSHRDLPAIFPRSSRDCRLPQELVGRFSFGCDGGGDMPRHAVRDAQARGLKYRRQGGLQWGGGDMPRHVGRRSSAVSEAAAAATVAAAPARTQGPSFTSSSGSSEPGIAGRLGLEPLSRTKDQCV
eukprot:gene9263-biopygen6342